MFLNRKHCLNTSLLFTIILLCAAAVCIADQGGIFQYLATSEIPDMKEGLQTWDDPEMQELLAKAFVLTDDKIKGFYEEFKATIVTPPDPDTGEQLEIDKGQISLARSVSLGRTFHNLLAVMKDDNQQRYGDLIHIMRDVLYLDSKHIPLALQRDNSRDKFWYDLHNKWVSRTEERYMLLFGEPEKN